MGNYIFWSSSDHVHQLNASRVKLPLVKVDYVASLKADLINVEQPGSYIFSDCLLLRNIFDSGSSLSDADIEIGVGVKDVDDSPLRTFLHSTLNVAIDPSLSIIYLKFRSFNVSQGNPPEN